MGAGLAQDESITFDAKYSKESLPLTILPVTGENVDVAVAEMLHELMKPDADFEAGSRFEQQLAENRARRAETVRKESWWYRWGLSRSTPRERLVGDREVERLERRFGEQPPQPRVRVRLDE